MPILELFPKPAQSSDPTETRKPIRVQPPPGPGDDRPAPAQKALTGQPATPPPVKVKVRTGRYGELEEHELIHLLDSLDDERSRARFRESIYISVIVYLAVAWFLFYGPRLLWHQPVLRDPIALMKEHDKELTYITPSVPKVAPPRPVIDRKTMEQLQKQMREAPPTPQPPAPEPAPPEQAHNVQPPAPQAPIPLPEAPRPAQPTVEAPLPAAPQPSFAQNNSSARNNILNAARGGLNGHSGATIGAPGTAGPLQAGATILSDTGDWDYRAYMRRLHDDIQRNWDPLIPEEVEAPLLKKGVVGIRFTILRDGELSQPMILETVSGDVALDRAAWNAITSEGRFPPLPKEYHGQQLELRIGFFYNTPIPQ